MEQLTAPSRDSHQWVDAHTTSTARRIHASDRRCQNNLFCRIFDASHRRHSTGQSPSEPIRIRLMLVPLVPMIVLVVGVAAAVCAGVLGIASLRKTSDMVAQNRADTLAATLAPRLRSTEEQAQIQVIRRAARRSGAEILIASHDGTVVASASTETPTADRVLRLLVQARGETTTKLGRVKFGSRPLGPPFETLAVIVFVSAPIHPAGTNSLVSSLIVLTALLVGVAVVVAFAVAREIHSDVDFVRREIEKMAEPQRRQMGAAIRIGMMDQVGALTEAFNLLMDRFSAAQRAYEKDLENSVNLDRNRASFLATLSHELRTPLNAILGFADVLLSEVDGPLTDDTRENLAMVRASGAHLRGLIDDVLELSALESGQLRLSPTVVDARAVAEDVMREAAAWVRQKPIELRVIGPSPTYVWADERRLWQVLSNLVSNAIKFTDQGHVHLTTESRGTWAYLTVTDTGMGIDEADFEAIFEEFRQLEPHRSKVKGTGLGLFIARRLVQMHGGTVNVRSTSGLGSEFEIRLPSCSKESLSDMQNAPSPRAQASSQHSNKSEESSQ